MTSANSGSCVPRIQVGDRECEWRPAPKERLEIIDFHDAYARAGEELGEMLPAPRRLGRQ